jgi:hypothetical protein
MSEIATGSKEDKQARVRKAVCGESRMHGLEQGKGASPTYCYNRDIIFATELYTQEASYVYKLRCSKFIVVKKKNLSPNTIFILLFSSANISWQPCSLEGEYVAIWIQDGPFFLILMRHSFSLHRLKLYARNERGSRRINPST